VTLIFAIEDAPDKPGERVTAGLMSRFKGGAMLAGAFGNDHVFALSTGVSSLDALNMTVRTPPDKRDFP